MFEELAQKSASWLSGEGNNPEIVLSSRVRLARNITSFPFPPVADTDSREKVLSYVQSAIHKAGDLKNGSFYASGELSDLDMSFLMERHLISPEFLKAQSSRGLYVDRNEAISIMVNEEDHLRIQAIKSGLDIRSSWESADKADDQLAHSLQFDYDPSFGYLTSCPTNVGTGMRASVLVHLPALVLTREIEKVIGRISKVGLTVRGFYGEGTDVLGNLFQISNQTTLGRSEEDIIGDLERVTTQIIEYEEKSRTTLNKDAKDQIEDKIWRAYGILTHARVLTSSEVMNLLSAIRLGLGMGTLTNLSLGLVNELLILSQPAHLQKSYDREMNSSERDMVRAELVRSRLKG
jgi:protein arginine kinase